MNSAVPVTMLAFTYQSRYALRQLLKAIHGGKDAAVAVEALGDVEVRSASGVHLHELKMHAESGKLTERSLDLWKTLRIWSRHALETHIALPDTTLILATTHDVSAASALLEALTNEDRTSQINVGIVEELTAIAESGGNKANANGYRDFLLLTPEQRLAVVAQIIVIPANPSFAILDEEIERKAGLFFHGGTLPKDEWRQLIGWWDGKIKGMLLNPGSAPASAAELFAFIQQRRDLCSLEMPLECFEHEKPEDGVESDRSTYLRQLNLIKINGTGKLYAKRDFFRATLERDRWAQSLNTYARLLDVFDEQLVEIWERAKHEHELSEEAADETKKGARLYQQIMAASPVPLRTDWNPHRPYVTRGSFHLLANQPGLKPRIGWHPQFLKLLAEDER